MDYKEVFERRHLFGLAGRTAFAGALLSRPGAAQEFRMADGRLILNVRQFGAGGDGKTKDTAPIQKAIDACNAARGGIVYFAPGDYLTNTIVLKSHVTLYLESGATIVGGRELADWTHFPYTASAPRGGRHLVYADEASNIGIMGPGRIHGSGDAFRRKKTEAEIAQMFASRPDGWRVAHHWTAPLKRPDAMVSFRRCTGVHIYDVLLTDPPNWNLHPVACDSVFVRGITIRTPFEAANGDGIDPNACTNVIISDCNISSSDDAIALKNHNPYGSNQASRNITVTNCTIETPCTGVRIHEARGAGFENITFSNCVLHCAESPDENRMITGFEIACDGVAGVVASNISMHNVRQPIHIKCIGATSPPGLIRDVMLNHLYANRPTNASAIGGAPRKYLENIELTHVHLAIDGHAKREAAHEQVPVPLQDYPEVAKHRRLPSYGLYARHIRGMKLEDTEFELLDDDVRPALICDDVHDLDIDGLAYTAPRGGQPGIRLSNTKRVFIRGSSAPPGTQTFLQLEGGGTGGVTLIGNDFSEAAQEVATLGGVPAGAVFDAANRPAKS